jgi:hypothetical protein
MIIFIPFIKKKMEFIFNTGQLEALLKRTQQNVSANLSFYFFGVGYQLKHAFGLNPTYYFYFERINSTTNFIIFNF